MQLPLHFEWDDEKRRSNWLKHGVDFLDVVLIFEDDHITRKDDRQDYGEDRWRAIGKVGDDCLEVVFARRADAIRLIAAWKGGKRVRRDFEAIFARRDQGDEGAG